MPYNLGILGPKKEKKSCLVHELSVIMSVLLDFVVNTVLIQYCVYYQIYWNRLYELLYYVNRIEKWGKNIQDNTAIPYRASTGPEQGFPV